MGSMTKAVLYYTSNRERPEVESAVQRVILRNCGGIPIVSVSQRAIGFGLNFTVGDRGVSQTNILRQIDLGLQATTADVIYLAEADVLYPPAYFRFEPSRDTIHFLGPLYLYWYEKPRFPSYFEKSRSEGVVVARRKYLAAVVQILLAGRPKWQRDVEQGTPRTYTDVARCVTSDCGEPIVSIKTKGNMHQRSNYSKRNKTPSLPLWGDGATLVERIASEHV